jgi:hypothetical protein
MYGRLGRDVKLGTDASSGGRVDLLSVAVELEAARPESLRMALSRCFLDLKSREGVSGAVFGLYERGLTSTGTSEVGVIASGVDGTAGLFRPNERALKLPFDLCRSKGT